MKLVFATHNQNKLKEIKVMLPEHIELLSLNDIGCTEEIEETGETIEQNAALKAQYVKDTYGYNCFADDTGLEVESLNNAPGVYSARYAGAEKNDEKNLQKLLEELKDKSNRNARFKTVIALTINEQNNLFTGICAGQITKQKSGSSGFGYDPVFKPKGYTKTFAEMSLTEKATISHRGKAVKQLVDYLKQ
ncbi:non-canonical purine NTP diphosphatase [Haloflavibacter putidus]|uniref:dITP/XTP pyrophosphatase n=1 Tax=Haloflavibacter putidus TaxID=2576776 RepID=A0A507ZRD4_9FLAO|nr:non-canonical purine NTP diphosphatase [Haloflavibacter putidus]TQD39111.1 non-canonical purine NTP diphosphatase [Haloflavibacter putidus]